MPAFQRNHLRMRQIEYSHNLLILTLFPAIHMHIHNFAISIAQFARAQSRLVVSIHIVFLYNYIKN